MMTSTENRAGDLHVVAETEEIVALCLEGDFDLANASQIIEEGERLLGARHLILDLGRATFIDSAVIHALFQVAAEAKRRRRVVVLQLGTAAIVERLIEVSGMDRVIARTKTRLEAIDRIRQLHQPAE
jgi:anti-anti-sigma factor